MLNNLDLSVTKNVYIGLMCGTSLDSMDAVAVDFPNGNQNILRGKASIVISVHTKLRIQKLIESWPYVRLNDIQYLQKKLAVVSINVVKELLYTTKLLTSQIVAIASHGVTLAHYPTLGYSIQLGDAELISQQTGIDTVYNLRQQDIIHGGQGAPLACAYHKDFLCSKTMHRAILNLGGIANITILPKSGDHIHNNILGYDTGPANTLMDAWVNKCLAEPFDIKGQWAATGRVKGELLVAMLQHPYFAKSAPKSTGKEDFNLSWLEKILSTFPPILPQDVQATLCELTAVTIVDSLLNHSHIKQLIICGGGAYNDFLIARLKDVLGSKSLSGVQILKSASIGIEPQLVESAAFAWLAYLNRHNLAGNIAAVTGAKKGVVLGQLALP